MPKYYFSGIDRREFIELIAREGAAGMLLWDCVNQPAIIKALARFPDVTAVIDSGFKKKPTNDQYIKLLLEYGHRFDWFGNNDVIGNQVLSDENYKIITSTLPGDFARKVVWIYQTGSMDYLAEKARGKTIGIGGLVPRIKADVQAAIDYIGNIGQVLDRVGAKAHLFGVGSPDIILAFRDEKWFESADSQSWISGFKARELIRQDGRRISATRSGFIFEQAECAAQNIRVIHSWLNNNVQLAFEVTR